MCCLLPVQKVMGFHTRAWQNSTSPALPFLSLYCRNTSIFWGSGWEHFLSLKFSAHKNTEQKPLCPLQLMTSTEYLQTASKERLGTFGNVSDIYLLTSSQRNFLWEAFSWAMFFWNGTGVYVLSWKRMSMKEMVEICKKKCAIHSGKWKSNWQVELAAMDLHIINFVGVFTLACYCSATQHRLV